MCFVDLEKAFESSKKSCKVGDEKKIPQMMVKAVMSLYRKSTKIRV